MRVTKLILIIATFVMSGGMFSSLPVSAADNEAKDTLVRFKGGIGVIPISNIIVAADGTITVDRNMVRGVNSAGQIWTIDDLLARIKTTGEIKVDGRGLVLAGGNNIGTPPAGTSVFASLLCGATGTTVHSTGASGVPLAADGDFRIDDVLDPPPPPDCANPVLLIRSVNGGNWFAAGIPDLRDHRRD
jgi:hypothetical protein